MNSTFRFPALILLAFCVVSPAFAVTGQSYVGNFSTDADSPSFSFTLSSSAPVTIRTYSYAGGTNQAGSPIPAGGFDPTISLYDSQGNFLIGNRDGGCGNVAGDAVTSFCWDSFLNLTLPSGTYIVVLTQSENLPNGPTLASSFVYAGQPTFTTPPGVASQGFWDLFPSKRTSAYALDVVSTALVLPPPPVTPVQPPSLSITGSGSLGGFIPGATIAGTFTASGGVAPYAWSALGLPAGLSLDSATGAFSGSGGSPGVYSFGITVSDSESPVVQATLKVSYSVLGITTSGLPNGSVTAAYNASLAAIGGTGLYSFSATGLPAGVSLSSVGVFSGTPQKAGEFTIVVQVTSGGLTTSSLFTLAVTGLTTSPLTVSSVSLTSGTVGALYASASGLQATGGTAPYSWSVFGGVLPGGMSLSGSGILQGTPTLAGTYGFAAQVTDSAGTTATGSYTLLVNPAPLTFSLGTFPTGVSGVTYPIQILTPLASGGQPAYTFAVTGGIVPAGMTLTGQEISGIPTVPGTFTFTVTVTDTAGKTATANGSIVIGPAQANLILSQTSVSFSLTAGASGVPTPASVTVRSSVVATLLNYSFTVAPTAQWLDVAGGGTTPGSLTISLDATAPSFAPSATAYSTVVAVTCIAPSPCAGSTQNINVSLTISTPPAQLVLSTGLLSFTAENSSPAASSQTLGLQNVGGGTIAISSITPGANWLTVTGAPSTLTPGPATSITLTANPSGLSPGYFTTTLTVNSSAGSETIPVTLLLTSNLLMTLGPAGGQFSAPAGSSPGNANGSFNVQATGAGTISWTAALLPGASWLTLNTTSGTSTAASAGAISYSLNPSVIASLAPATYFATITVSATGVADPVQQYQVVLNVTPAGSAVNPGLSAAGLIFTSSAAGTTGAQNLSVYASSNAPISYQVSAATSDGSAWLVVSPATGAASVAAAGASAVSVNVKGLPAGVYSGGVSYAFSGYAVSTVNVTLLILPGGTVPAGREAPGISSAVTTTCKPTKLIGTQTGLYSNFSQMAGLPTQVSIALMDDCGAPFNGATLTSTFSNGDGPLSLLPRDTSSGIYVGTWTPVHASPQVTVTSTAVSSQYAISANRVTGEVTTSTIPIITANAYLDVFSPVVGDALAPGQAIQIYGTNLAAQTAIGTLPLPTSLAGTTVLIDGIAAPLYYVSAGQIDAQIPLSLSAGSQYQIQVSVNSALSSPAPLQLAAVAPAIANLGGQIIAQHAADYSPVTASSPAVPGEFVVLYLSGLGATTNPVAVGTPAPASPASNPIITPTLTLNGATLPTSFIGLTPTAVGLYQINFQVPANVAAGNLTLYVTQGGVQSNQVSIPAQ